MLWGVEARRSHVLRLSRTGGLMRESGPCPETASPSPGRRWRADSASPATRERRSRERLRRPDDARGIDLHPRAHGRGDGDALDVGALGAGRFRLGDGVREGADVLDELAVLERGLADAGMD